eukprot:gene2947-4183_t
MTMPDKLSISPGGTLVTDLPSAWVESSLLTQPRPAPLLVGVRDDEARLRFLGFRTDRIKLFAWCLSAAVAALAGMLYVPQVGIINPTIVSPMLSVEIAVWVAIGGRGTLVGAVLGAVLVNGLKFWLSAQAPRVWPFILAGITLVITVCLGNGLWSTVGALQRPRRAVP